MGCTGKKSWVTLPGPAVWWGGYTEKQLKEMGWVLPGKKDRRLVQKAHNILGQFGLTKHVPARFTSVVLHHDKFTCF